MSDFSNHAKFISLLSDIEFVSSVLHREQESQTDELLSGVLEPLEEVSRKLYEVLVLMGSK